MSNACAVGAHSCENVLCRLLRVFCCTWFSLMIAHMSRNMNSTVMFNKIHKIRYNYILLDLNF